jgi:hypothetical protein
VIAKEESDRMKKADFKKWPTHSAKVRADLNIPLDYNPWTESGMPCKGVPSTQRCKDLLNVAWAARLAEYPSESHDALRAIFL